MFNFNKYVASLVTMSSVLYISSSAWAAPLGASSQSTLYWNTFSGLNNFTWVDRSTNAESRVANAWDMDNNVLVGAPASEVDGWGNLDRTSFYSSNPNISASGVVAGDILTASAVTEVINPGDLYTADAASWRNGVFSVSQDSTYTFSIDYSFSQSLAISGSPGSYAAAMSYVYFTLHEFIWDENKNEWVPLNLITAPKSENYMHSLFGGVEMPFTSDDYATGIQTFSFDQELEAGKYYNFTGGAYTYSGAQNPVPVPGAVWLLGSGLLGLISIRRKSAK
jgi:uncharacterized membrane protein